MEIYISTRQFYFLVTVLLAVLGNQPRSGVRAQDGTTMKARQTTVAVKKTTIGLTAARQTTVAGFRPSTVFQDTYKPTGPVTPNVPGGQTQFPQPTTQKPVGGGGGGKPTTRRPGGGGGASQGATQTPTTRKQRKTKKPTKAPATTTSQPTTATTPKGSRLQFNIEYELQTTVPLGGKETDCISQMTRTLAAEFAVSTTRVVSVTCTEKGTNRVIVTAVITPGNKPTLEEMEKFKQDSSRGNIVTDGWDNANTFIRQGTFKYTRSFAAEEVSGSDENRILGLTQTHWIFIGMGGVILLLFIIAVTVICRSRRSGGPPQSERMTEEASVKSIDDSEADEKPKKKWCGFLRSKKDHDGSSSDVSGNRTDDESAYESTADLASEAHSDTQSERSSNRIDDDDKIF